MKNIVLPLLLIVSLLGCDKKKDTSAQHIVTTDIDNFWDAYDKITTTQDSILQYKYIDSLYIQKGTLGLKSIMEARNYTQEDYINAINKYPEFWSSIRENTLKTTNYVSELNEGIEKMRGIYPELKPAKMYFTIGALRTNGTTVDNLVLIGSELAMADKNTIASEFKGNNSVGRRKYFNSNPIDDLVLLNIHEYVHTQQNEQVDNLLSYSLREGIAEFVSTTAMHVPSATPAINYGKRNDNVKKKFEEEMFFGNNIHHWLWSDFQNEFNTRDLGYYIGYSIAEIHYNKAENKQEVIKEMIELDYTNETQIENFVDGTHFFSMSLEKLYQDYEKRRPTVVGIKPFDNFNKNVDVKINSITIEFSESMNQEFRNFDFGPLGKEALIRIKKVIGYSEDGKSITFEIEDLKPNKHYQLTIGSGFRNLKNVPLKAYLVDFKTSK